MLLTCPSLALVHFKTAIPKQGPFQPFHLVWQAASSHGTCPILLDWPFSFPIKTGCECFESRCVVRYRCRRPELPFLGTLAGAKSGPAAALRRREQGSCRPASCCSPAELSACRAALLPAVLGNMLSEERFQERQAFAEVLFCFSASSIQMRKWFLSVFCYVNWSSHPTLHWLRPPW